MKSIHNSTSHSTRLACVHRPEEAYFHVPIAEDFQKFLWFAVGRIHLQFTCLPFWAFDIASCVFKYIIGGGGSDQNKGHMSAPLPG